MNSLDDWIGSAQAAHTLPVFTNAREANDIDLVGEVRGLLQRAGLGMNAQLYFDTDRDIIDAANIGSQGQRHLLNRFFNFQLLQGGASTQNARFHLVDSGEIRDWLGLFEQVVLPVLIERNLPSALH